MEIEEIAGTLNTTENVCEDIIANDKNGQYEALKQQISSLNGIVAEKDKQIKYLLKQVEGVKSNITQFVEFLMNESDSKDRDTLLTTIHEEKDMNEQLESLFKLIIIDYSNANEDQKIIHRMKNQLYSHLELLSKLIDSQDYQDMFLTTNNEDQPQLTEETRNIMINQAKHTSELLNKMKNNDADDNQSEDDIGVSNIFERGFDATKRVRNIQKLLSNSILTPDEIRDMIIQEATITSLFSKYIDNVLQKVAYLEDINTSQTNNEKKNKAILEEKAKHVFESLCEALSTKESFSMEKLFELTQILSDDCIAARNKIGLKVGGFSVFVDKTDRAINKLANKLEQTQKLLERQTSELTTKTNDKWAKWAKHLYTALLGFGSSTDDESMRIAIETAALTSVGQLRKHFVYNN